MDCRCGLAVYYAWARNQLELVIMVPMTKEMVSNGNGSIKDGSGITVSLENETKKSFECLKYIKDNTSVHTGRIPVQPVDDESDIL